MSDPEDSQKIPKISQADTGYSVADKFARLDTADTPVAWDWSFTLQSVGVRSCDFSFPRDRSPRALLFALASLRRALTMADDVAGLDKDERPIKIDRSRSTAAAADTRSDSDRLSHVRRPTDTAPSRSKLYETKKASHTEPTTRKRGSICSEPKHVPNWKISAVVSTCRPTSTNTLKDVNLLCVFVYICWCRV